MMCRVRHIVLGYILSRFALDRGGSAENPKQLINMICQKREEESGKTGSFFLGRKEGEAMKKTRATRHICVSVVGGLDVYQPIIMPSEWHSIQGLSNWDFLLQTGH